MIKVMAQHLDHVSLRELKSIMEDDFDLLINTFIGDSNIRVDALKNAVAAQDAQALRAAAHSFKGSSLNICAPDLAELCRLMELAGKDNDLNGVADLLQKIEDEFAVVAASLRDL